jgi:hypothetical protein
MNLRYLFPFLLMLLFSLPAFGQLDSVYYEFGIGSVASGATQTTDNFSAEPIKIQNEEMKVIPNPEGTNTEPVIVPTDGSEILPPLVYVEDPNATQNTKVLDGNTVLLKKFQGIPMTNYIPPDCIMAVGPNHVIACVNSMFYIWDKQGTILKVIPASTWWSPAWPDENGDPQVIYDQFAQRWVLVWMQYNATALTAGNLIAYSDDDDPLGTWYMFRLDTKTNGTIQTNNWGDYPQLGYDDEAIYIATRAFGFSGGGPFYTKVRIISKSDLYTNSTTGFSYRDYWNIGLPGTPSQKPDGIHPSYSYTLGEGGYMFWASRSGGNVYAAYKFNNPTSSTPNLRGTAFTVQYYYNTPNANQLGGGTPLIDANGSQVKTAPVIRDGKMYIAHSVGNANYPPDVYASARYVIYDLSSNTITEQAELGAQFYYYIFPTLTVDQNSNIAMTFSRSATIEYIGGYYATKYAADPPGLNPSQPLAEGQGNYVVTYNGTRNRWGDYLGICVDPADENNIWLFPEYAAATNTWGTMVGEIRMAPFPGGYTYISSDSVTFGDVEINTISDTLEVVIANYGTDDLEITSVASGVGPFTAIPDQSIPLTLHTFDSLSIKIYFAPQALGDYDEVLVVSSSDPNLTGVELTGHCYEINIPYTDIFYASSGGGNNGDMLTIDRETGVGTALGPSLFGEITSLAVNPMNDVLYGLVAAGSHIVRVNAALGDAYTLFTLDIPGLTGISFDNTGTLYACNQDGDIYTIDLSSGYYAYVSTSSHPLNAICFNPNTDELFGALKKGFGNYKDSVYTIDLLTGEATAIGRTGFNVLTNDMTFDEDGKLYGVSGTNNQEGKIFEIDQTDGTGTLIGTGIGYNHTTGLAFSINGPILSVGRENSVIPEEYSLKQNYPNPFNPETKIEFSLPVTSEVQIVIYNILGQQVATLINEQKNAGNYSVVWNADDAKGIRLSSGIYFYMLKASGVDGNGFQQIKKMILLK